MVVEKAGQNWSSCRHLATNGISSKKIVTTEDGRSCVGDAIMIAIVVVEGRLGVYVPGTLDIVPLLEKVAVPMFY